MVDNPFASAVDEANSRSLSANVAEDIVEYLRGNIIGNEQQGLVAAFQSVSGLLYEMDNYSNVVFIGEKGGGKTKLQNELLEVIPNEYLYRNGNVTGGSDNAFIDDPMWDYALLAPLDEYDKLQGNNREFLKSMYGEDGGFTKMRNVEDQSAKGGYSPDEITSTAVPFQILYAPTGQKTGLQIELDDRMIKVPVEFNSYISEAIGRTLFGHENIEVEGYDHEYIYDTNDVASGLRTHLRGLLDERIATHDDEGEQIGWRGSLHVHIPDWVWYACQPIFDPSTTDTNRVYGMLVSLIKGSAVWNHHENPRTDIYVEDRDQTVEHIVATPQDVANVLSCQEMLLGTTHGLDAMKRDILEAVEAQQGVGEGSGATLNQVHEWLNDNNKVVPSESKLRSILKEDLVEDYYIDVYEGVAGPNGQADAFERRRHSKLATPRVRGLTELAADDGMDISCPWVDDVDRPFKNARDPIHDRSFEDHVSVLDERFTPDSQPRTAADAMGDPTATDDTTGQVTLDGGDDGETTLPDDVIVHAVYDRLADTLGEIGTPFNADDDVQDEHLLGVTESGVTPTEEDRTDTVFDPSHPLWSHDTLADSRVTTRQDAAREIADAVGTCLDVGALRLDAGMAKAADYDDGELDADEGFVSFETRPIANDDVFEYVP